MSPAIEAMQQAEQQHYLGKGVLLEPFVHQVGGHSCVLRFGEQTICKPLIPREHQFYRSLPAAMRKFTPQYRGVVSVSFEEDEEGNLCLIAYPLHSEVGDLENVHPSADLEPKQNKTKWANKMLLDNEGYGKERARNSRKDKDKSLQREEEREWLKQAEVLYYTLERSNAVPQLKHNPWSLKCHQRHLQRMKDNAKHRNQYKFILLENLTWRHKVPCVLDLKMGTRQHGDDATEEKKAMQIRKCQQSTSASIGVRLCGMQVYQSGVGQLMFMNKYQGRKLTLPGFKEAIYQFFHDGQRLRGELLSPVLRRLREMQAALEACESYRFYSSSLLIIYDGEPPRARRTDEEGLSDREDDDEDDEEEEEDDEEEEEEEGVVEEGAFGFPHSGAVAGAGCSSSSSSSSNGGSSSAGSLGVSGSSAGSLSSSSNSSSGGSSNGSGAVVSSAGSRRGGARSQEPMVDVRMIDFAHTTCRHYDEDSVVHEGKDSGYIFGLQNLITIISQLEDHSTD
ncbi:hypothetical protein ACEWY4_027873 [Coilia grayii]|uniref:Kinase n=1 Tax=Coilia grayii TaxID=363190 RepID=A0ABD1INX8_9TELE